MARITKKGGRELTKYKTQSSFGSQRFDRYVCIGDSIRTTMPNGRTYVARIEHDDNSDAPWENEDGHGPVSGWCDIESKRPGQRVIIADRGRARFYDIEEATKIALRDRWDAEPYKTGTPGEQAARAVERDFQVLRAWCHDEWDYVGVVISYEFEDEDGREGVVDYVASLWGIERNFPGSDNSYITDVANKLLSEALGEN